MLTKREAPPVPAAGLTHQSGFVVVHPENITRNPFNKQKITYTIFPDLTGETKREHTADLSTFLDKVTQAPKVYPTKASAPLISGLSFGDIRTDTGCLRHDGNVTRVHMLVGDHNDGLMSPSKAVEMLTIAGIAAVIVTSASHTPEKPRWHVFAWLSAPCAPRDYRHHMGVLNGALGGILGAESFALSRSYYIGRFKGVPYETVLSAGYPVDMCVTVDPHFGNAKATTAARPAPSHGHDMAGLVSDQQLADLRSALDHMAKAEPVPDYTAWTAVGQALKTMGPDGLALWVGYSEACANGDPGDAESKWPQLRGERTSIAAVFAKAQALGWVNPRSKPTAQGLIDELRKLPRDQVLDRWTAITLPLTRDVAADVVAEVVKLTGVGRRALNAALNDARQEKAATAQRESAGDREVLGYRPQDSTAQAGVVGRLITDQGQPGDLIQFAGMPCAISEGDQPFAHAADSDEPPPLTMRVKPHTLTTLRGLVERHAVFIAQGARGPNEIPVPNLILAALLELDPAKVPHVSGLLSHPIVRHDGSILSTNGHDKGTGLFLYDVPTTHLRPYSQAEAVRAFSRLAGCVLEGFEFVSQLNAHIAIAGLFTAVLRRLLDAAPALVILAPQQSSGKTTLARRLFLILTGRDLPVNNLPVGDPGEIEKRVLALLLSSPAMICFDNVADGLTLNVEVLNAVLTSSVFEGRVLGGTRMASAPTNVFICFTGNNLRLGKDEGSRCLTTTLQAATARPDARRFAHPDVVTHARSIRDQVLRDVVGIVAGFIQSGDKVKLATGTRFPQWDRMVRSPLVWAGAEDVAQSFTHNDAEAEHLQALRALLLSLREIFGTERFNARAVVNAIDGGCYSDANRQTCRDALEMLAVRDLKSSRSVGRALAAHMDRAVTVGERGLRLQARVDRNGISSFVVTDCGVCGI